MSTNDHLQHTQKAGLIMNQQLDINQVIARRGITATAARLFYIINGLVNLSRNRNFKDKRGIPYCYASKAWLAGQIGKSERTVTRAIRELKDAGMIESHQTIRNARIFVTDYGTESTDTARNGAAGTDKNVRLNNETYNYKNTADISIHQSTIPTPGAEANAENSEQGRASYATATTAAAEGEGQRRGMNAGQVESTGTPRSRGEQRQEAQTPAPAAGRIGADGRHHGQDQSAQGMQMQGRDEAKRREVREILRNNCHMESMANHCNTPDAIEDYEQMSAVIDMVADVASVKGGFVKVLGMTLTNAQWLHEVLRNNEFTLSDTINRVMCAEARGIVKNLHAYMCAALYNGARQGRITGICYPF